MGSAQPPVQAPPLQASSPEASPSPQDGGAPEREGSRPPEGALGAVHSPDAAVAGGPDGEGEPFDQAATQRLEPIEADKARSAKPGAREGRARH